MKKLILIILLVSSLIFFFKSYNHGEVTKKPELEKFRFALDWTPNTNHTGLYVAQNKGWFQDEGIDLEILPFSSSVSPDVLVNTGKADAGVGFTEWIIADAALGSPVVSIAAILAHNTSALIALENDSIKSPKDLSGKIYGGYGAPYEESVVKEMIKTAGGKPVIRNITLDVEALKALESGKIDFLWGYMGWEMIQGRRDGYKLRAFPVTEYGIPDYYTPNIITSPKNVEEKKELLKKFMRALSRGYEFARNNPKESALILIKSAPKGTFADETPVYESQDYLSGKYVEQGKKWGYQSPKMWMDFPKFILSSQTIRDKDGAIVSNLDFNLLYTNDFLPE